MELEFADGERREVSLRNWRDGYTAQDVANGRCPDFEHFSQNTDGIFLRIFCPEALNLNCFLFSQRFARFSRINLVNSPARLFIRFAQLNIADCSLVNIEFFSEFNGC